MDKELFGLTVIPAAFFGGTVVACASKRIRDLFFVVLVFSCCLIERLDLNFVSHDWYRGTSRGFEVAVLDVLSVSLLISSVLFPRDGYRRFYWPPAFGLMLLFFFYACFNVAVSDPKLFGLFELSRMFRGLVLVLAVAFYVQSAREVRLLVLGLAAMLIFESLLGLKQRYLEGVHRVPGTLIESNSLSVLLCTVTPVMVAAAASKIPRALRWICLGAIPLACVAEILTISRAGVMILGSVLFATALATVPLRFNLRTVCASLLILLGTAGLIAKSWKTLGERFHESTFKQEYENKKNLGRGYYLRIAAAIASDRILGVGLNNWSYWVSNEYGPRLGYRFVPYAGVDHVPSDQVPPTSNVDMAQAAPAHCLGALTLGELGIPGLFLLFLLWVRWFQMGGSFLSPKIYDPLRQIGVGIFFGSWGMFLQNLTEWVFRHVPLYYTFHVMLGALISLYYLRRQARKRARAAQPVPAQTPVPQVWVSPAPSQ